MTIAQLSPKASEINDLGSDRTLLLFYYHLLHSEISLTGSAIKLRFSPAENLL